MPKGGERRQRKPEGLKSEHADLRRALRAVSRCQPACFKRDGVEPLLGL